MRCRMNSYATFFSPFKLVSQGKIVDQCFLGSYTEYTVCCHSKNLSDLHGVAGMGDLGRWIGIRVISAVAGRELHSPTAHQSSGAKHFDQQTFN